MSTTAKPSPDPKTISEVIEALGEIVDEAINQGSALGYFPALYRRVTIQVEQAIQAGRFDDGERMENLDVIFAKRYLDAYDAHRTSLSCTSSWAAAFSACSQTKLIVLQHLLLGMNAHISLDLGIAAAEVAGNDPLSLKKDFNVINDILGSQINDTQSRLELIFRPLGFADRLLGDIDEQFSLFSLRYARDKAWTQTLELTHSSPDQQEALIDARDRRVADFAKQIANPPKLRIRILLAFIRLLERGNATSRLKALYN